MSERRKSGLRRDFNDLVRDESGNLSPTKIGTLVGQWLSVKIILEHGSEIIANWDSLLVLFAVLIAPELFKKLLNMKYGNGHDVQIDKLVRSEERISSRQPAGDPLPGTDSPQQHRSF